MSRSRPLDRPLDSHDHVLGAPTASVSLVAYVDYQCEFSAEAFSTIEAVHLHLGSQVRFALRHFPLDKHKQAALAAEAAMAAGAQGRFWEMSALLFEHQDALEREDLLRYAQELRLDLGRFTRELDEGTYREQVKAQRDAGKKAGVKQTPSLFINGKLHEGERDLRSLVNALEEVGRKLPQTYGDREEHPFIGG